jgi:transcriptional regulator with XRE-family HTH domain
MTSAKAGKIQELREARGMSVDELSRRMSVDQAMVRRWESGAEIDDGSLRRLADSLGVSQDELRHEGDVEHHGDRID